MHDVRVQCFFEGSRAISDNAVSTIFNLFLIPDMEIKAENVCYTDFYGMKKKIQNKLKGGQYRRESPPMLVNTYVEKQQKRRFCC